MIAMQRIEQLLMRLVENAERFRRVIRARVRLPARVEHGRHVNEYRTGRKALLYFFGGRLEMRAVRARVREHLEHFDLVARRGRLRRIDEEIVLAFFPRRGRGRIGREGRGRRDESREEEAEPFQHDVLLEGCKDGPRSGTPVPSYFWLSFATRYDTSAGSLSIPP